MGRVSLKKMFLLLVVATFIIIYLVSIELQIRHRKRQIVRLESPAIVTTPSLDLDVDVENCSNVPSNFTSGDFELNSTFLCEKSPSTLLGAIPVDINLGSLPADNSVQFGGWWKPVNCTARVKVAILLPYRKRPEQLQTFLSHMIPVFQRQLLAFRIFVVEQLGKTAFNKGAIYNIGFNATFDFDDYDCYIFHDIDLLAENDKNYYGCPTSPRHMSVAIDKFKYKLPYLALFGGIQAFKKEHYISANGYSNKYWGWGAEDDDLFRRIEAVCFKLTRPSSAVGRYKMNQKHHFRSDSWNNENAKIFGLGLKGRSKDGLNSISSLNFTVDIHEEKYCTFVSIDLVKPRIVSKGASLAHYKTNNHVYILGSFSFIFPFIMTLQFS